MIFFVCVLHAKRALEPTFAVFIFVCLSLSGNGEGAVVVVGEKFLSKGNAPPPFVSLPLSRGQ